MVAENSFARLFRPSSFARYDPKAGRIYRACPVPLPTNSPQTTMYNYGEGRPKHFGFKRDLPAYLHGKPLEAVDIRKLDGDFGQAELDDGSIALKTFKVIREARQAQQLNQRIPARILNKTKDGYAVGIGGVVGALSQADLPENFKFTNADLCRRRAYWVYVRSAQIEPDGKPSISVSLRKPLTPLQMYGST